MNSLNLKLTYKKKDLISLVLSSKILFLFCCLPFFKNSGFESIPLLSSICDILLIFEFFFLLFLIIRSKCKNTYFNYIIVFATWSYIISPFLGNHQSESLFYLFEMLGIIFFVDVALRFNFRKSIYNFSFAFNFMILLNFLSVIFFEHGFITDLEIGEVYLFGLRTGFSLVIIPGILFNLINTYINHNNKLNFQLIVCFLFSFLTLLNKWVVTGLIELMIIIFMLLLIPKKQKKWIAKNISKIFIFIIIINISMTFFGNSLNFVSAIAGFMNKDITLSGRTYIWEQSVNKINLSPYFGYGINSTVDIFGIYKPAHNQWMHIALSSGYIGMILLIAIFYKSCSILGKQKDSNLTYIISVIVISISIGCITEIQIYFPFLYAIFLLPYCLKYVDDIKG